MLFRKGSLLSQISEKDHNWCCTTGIGFADVSGFLDSKSACLSEVLVLVHVFSTCTSTTVVKVLYFYVLLEHREDSTVQLLLAKCWDKRRGAHQKGWVDR